MGSMKKAERGTWIVSNRRRLREDPDEDEELSMI